MKHTVIAAVLAAAPILALAVGSDDTPVSERLANAHKAIAAKEWRAAMRELNAALRDEPKNPEVHNLLGYTYRVRPEPDLKKSFQHYETALKLNPDHKATLEYLGEAYLMDKRPAEAEKQLVRLEQVCGNKTCPEYQELFKAIADYKAKPAN
ncbi:tetratricopeptide repeat protein [Ramlibacter sp. PS4R-6]|uniref:tetratricopeptide repeat protein n=1 Tax=Ramlibacter sp. PS4R-6 TaxID=3133438 RepID=UPI0030B10F09